MGDIIATGSFDDMLELASDLATDEDSSVVIHKTSCVDPQEREDCPCGPLIVSPYAKVDESEIEGTVN